MSYRWRYSIYTSLSITVLALASIALTSGASAAPNSTSINALRVSPALSNIQLSAGEASATIVANITNQTSNPLVVDVTARDFGVLVSRAGAISFYGSGYNPSTNPHGLQSAISFDNSSITLAPEATQKVAITLNNVDKLAAGGHYGAVLFSPESLAASKSNTRLSIHSAVASLIFLRTASGGTQTLQLLPFSASSIRFSLPTTNYIVLNNSGNTQTAPQGQLTLYGPSGNIISTTVLNPGSGLILPGTSRLFMTQLPLPSMRFARPGIYRLQFQYRNSSQTKFTVITRSFYYINALIFIPVVIVLAIIVYLLQRYRHHTIRVTRKVMRRVNKRHNR